MLYQYQKVYTQRFVIGFNQLRIFFGSSINTCSFSQEFFSSSTVFENVFQKEEETYDKGNKLREGNQWNTITQLHGKLSRDFK